MSYRFPSAEWTEQFCHQINASDAYADAAKKWEGDIILIVEGQAGVYLDLWHGKCRKATYYPDPQTCDAEFKISAGMDKWKEVLKGELDPIKGIVSR